MKKYGNENAHASKYGPIGKAMMSLRGVHVWIQGAGLNLPPMDFCDYVLWVCLLGLGHLTTLALGAPRSTYRSTHALLPPIKRPRPPFQFEGFPPFQAEASIMSKHVIFG